MLLSKAINISKFFSSN